jgi:hypothetical protein
VVGRDIVVLYITILLQYIATTSSFLSEVSAKSGEVVVIMNTDPRRLQVGAPV